jgi:hypothetical protein
MKPIVILIALMLTLSNTAQDLYSDAEIKKIRVRCSTINLWVSDTNAEVFTFIDGSAFIDENGDTIYEGEGEQRTVSIYKKDNKIIRITDQYASYEGEARLRSIEYNLYNDTLIFVFTTESVQSYVPQEDKGFHLYKSEDRIYFKNLTPYYHLARSFSGYTSDLTDFAKDSLQEETGTLNDTMFIDNLNEIKTNYLTHYMKVYERVIEKLDD